MRQVYLRFLFFWSQKYNNNCRLQIIFVFFLCLFHLFIHNLLILHLYYIGRDALSLYDNNKFNIIVNNLTT